MKYTGELPQSQQDIIVDALRVYKEFIETLDYDKVGTELQHLNFDITTLVAIFKDMKVKVNYELDKEVFDNFVFRNGIDFPIYE